MVVKNLLDVASARETVNSRPTTSVCMQSTVCKSAANRHIYDVCCENETSRSYTGQPSQQIP